MLTLLDLSLGPKPDMAGTRHKLAAIIADLVADQECAFAFTGACGEALNNALIHGQHPRHVLCTVEHGTLCVKVQDHGSGVHMLAGEMCDPMCEHGRGIATIRQACSACSWGWSEGAFTCRLEIAL